MTTTLALIRLPDTVWRFEFGDSLDPEGNTPELLVRILEEYEHRHEEIGRLGNDARLLLIHEVSELNEDSPLLPRALDALGQFGRTDGWENVAARTKSDRREVSLAAIRTLGRMGKPASADAIVSFLSHPSIEFRRAALISIGKLAREDLLPLLQAAAGAAPELQPLLADAEQRIQATQRRDVEAVFDAVIETDEYRDLIPLGMVLANRIVRRFVDHDHPPKRLARLADLCGLMGLCEAAQKFIDLLSDEGSPLGIRIPCTAGLGRCRVEFALELVLQQLDRPEELLRATAVTALGLIGSPLAFGPLVRLWDDAGGSFRPRLRLALRRIASPPDTPSILALLKARRFEGTADFVVIDERMSLYRENAAAAVIASLLGSSLAAERLAASFIAAIAGRAEDLPQLRTMSEGDPDETVRVVANLAAAMLAGRRPNGR